MTEHRLKTWPEFFRALLLGTKTYEVRRNDRDFRVGDVLVLAEYDPANGEFSGHEVRRVVTRVDGANLAALGALGPDFCVMSIVPAEQVLTVVRYQETLREFNYTPHWDLPRWSNALTGELAEGIEQLGLLVKICNTVKKIDRGDFDRLRAKELLASELADIVAYVNHLANAAGIFMDEAQRGKFNEVAERVGSQLRL